VNCSGVTAINETRVLSAAVGVSACAPRGQVRCTYPSEELIIMVAIRTFALALVLASVLSAQAPATDDLIWKQYFTWFQQGDPNANTPQKYRAKLIADGLPEAQADEQLERLGKLSAQHRSDYVALFFDRYYTAPVAEFNTQPNAFLVSMTADVKPGAALDVAMGQGRNALYLAAKGWQVTGFDIAEKGLDAAQAEAAKRGLHITTVKSGYQEFDFGHEQWDLIVFSYAWVPLADPALLERVRASLKPGGLVVIEHPSEAPPTATAQGARAPDPLDEINALSNAWSNGFRILRYEDTEGVWDWRIRKARVLRLLAQKW
jgi:2-polyprenyl-3-methyl-5-hydroxy-6-metoxy-1,4-benzoquinol methylase